MFTYDYTIKTEETELPYAHVHHANALKILEVARFHFVAAAGFPLQNFLDKQLFIVISSIQIRYKRELVPGPVQITCENASLRGMVLVLDQRIILPNGKDAVLATIDLVFISGETRRAISPPEDFAEAFVRVGG